MGLHAKRIIALLWLMNNNATKVFADFSPTGGVTMTQIFTSGQDGAASAVTFYPIIYPEANDMNIMTRSNYSAYTTTAPAYVYGPGDLIDCDRSVTSFSASGTAPTYRNGSTLNGTITVPTSRTGPITIAPHVTLTPPVPFEEYWCSSYASVVQSSAQLSFQNNGTNKPQFHGLNPSAKTVCMSVEAENYSQWATTHAPSTSVGGFWGAIRPVVWTPTLTPPCCNTFCNLVVPSAQMQYWPTPAPAAMKNRTTYVGPDGFTYTSPSVYVVYRGISATNDCGQTLGSTTVDLTLSYAPSDLITFSNRVDGYTYKTIDFATIWSNCTDRYTYSSVATPPCVATVTTEEADCRAQISSLGAHALFWQEHCYPQLSFPPTTRLQGLNTAWKSCDMGNVDTSILGVFDPPRALKPGTAMMAPAPTETAGPPVPSIAQPASQAVPSQPEKTASPSTAHIGNDPSSNVNINSHPPVWAGSNNPGGKVDSSSEAPPTQTSKAQDPQQVGGSNPTVPAPINAPNADSPTANLPVADAPATKDQPTTNNQPAADNRPGAYQSAADPNNESAAQMFAFHQALGPAPAASPQSHSQPDGTPQQGSGSPAKLPASANSPATDGGAQPAIPISPQDQAANPPSSGLASKESPTNGGSLHGGTQPASAGSQPANEVPQSANGASQPVNVGTQPASGDTLPASGNSRNGASQPISGVSPPIVPGQNQGLSPPSNEVASSGSSLAGQDAQNHGPSPGTPVPAASPPPQFVIPVANGETLSGAVINPTSVIIAGSSGGATVQAGAPATQVLGHAISIDPAGSSAIIDGQVHTLTMQTPTPMSNDNQAAVPQGSSPDISVSAGSPQIQPMAGSNLQVPPQIAGAQDFATTTVANHNVAAIPSSPGIIIVDGQTIAHGATPVLISNTPVAHNSDGNLVIGTQTINNVIPSVAPTQSPPITTTIANHAIAAVPSSPGALLVDGHIISQGSSPAIISNTPVVYHSNGDLVLGTQTISNISPSIASLPSAASPAVFTVAGQVASVLQNGVGIAIAGATLLPNAPAIAISGTVSASYGSAGLIVGSSTIALPSSSPATGTPILLTVGGQVATVLPNNAGIAIAGTTLQVNGAAVPISGTIRASYGFAGLIVGTSTAAVPSVRPSQDSMTSITLAGQIFTYAVSPSVSASASFNSVVIGTSTIPYVSTGTNGAIFTGTSTLLYTSALIGTSDVPYTNTEPNGAIITSTSTALYTSPIAATGTPGVGSQILGGLNPNGPRSEAANGTQTGASSTSGVGAPTGLAGTSAAGGKGQVPVSGVLRVGISNWGLWIGALMAIMGIIWA